MSDTEQAREGLLRRILEGPGNASSAERRTAFDNSDPAGPVGALVDKVARHAYRVNDEDMNAVKRSGLTEDQVFEVVVCAAVGQASRQYDAALAALKIATGKE